MSDQHNGRYEDSDLYRIRHSSAHVMAESVLSLYPEAKLAIGPPIEDGFYYDFDFERPFREEDLPRIEAKMKEMVEADIPFVRGEMSSAEAIALFEGRGEDYKVELIRDLGAETVSIYSNGDFADLCRGPHIPSTGMVKAFRLMSSANLRAKSFAGLKCSRRPPS